MRKKTIQKSPSKDDWLDIESLASVEVTSEDPSHPIEGALIPTPGGRWQAAEAGEQTIRILFDSPQAISRIHLLFEENNTARTQEFTLGWQPKGETNYREIVRQQYNFSPPGTTSEREEFAVSLKDAAAIELKIIPDVGGAEVRASLTALRLA